MDGCPWENHDGTELAINYETNKIFVSEEAVGSSRFMLSGQWQALL